MDPLHLSQHISRQFNSEIEDVRRQVLAMGGLVEEQIAAALGMLVDRDAARGTEIREREQQVNAAELAIDERCAYILARRQPAASDLRLVLAVVKMLADLERIGDEAKRIAKLAEQLVGEEGGTDVTASLAELGTLARGQLRGALDAFARLDETLALDVMRRDKQLDEVYKELFSVLVERMQHAPATDSGRARPALVRALVRAHRRSLQESLRVRSVSRARKGRAALGACEGRRMRET